MRRRFENINTVAGGKIPVFACSISAPTTTWRNPVPILGCRYRSNGATMAASYVLDEINNSKVCTMGGNPINCTISKLHCFAMKMYSKRRKNKLEIISKDLENEISL